ncbi:MAG TPA: DUF6603 domain-containing protein, partial [Streptosporangiaceae bacterium]|nr:DUF6603 domain-containing protein [Streptosporangiaceae bacterium]
GGGFLRHDPVLHQYSGALQIQIQHLGGLGVTALGQVDTGLPDTDGAWALLAIVTVTFEHGVPLPLGFTLTGFGAVFAHNHTIDTDAIAAGLRTKALDAILFPPDPVAQAPHIFAVWKQTMPVAVGHTILGLMAKLSWGVGTHFGSFELAVLVEFGGGPIQFVLLGTLRLDMPTEKHGLLRLRADILGRLTLSPFNAQLLAEVYDSKLGTFTISGSVLAVVRTGPDPAYLLSVGGFNPHFTPPGGLPALNRFRVDISGSNNPSLRLEGYFAVTWQSIQLGARAQLHAAAGPVALDGWCSFDALIERRPQFLFSVELSAGMSLSYHGDVLAEVSADVLLIGPGPWHVHGYASFSVLFFSISIPFDKQWGDAGPPTSSTADPLTLVREALSDPSAWSASVPAGQPTLITLRSTAGGSTTGSSTAVPAHPLAELTCRQDVVPLGLTVTHIGDQPLAAPTSVDLTGLHLAGAPADGIAPVTDAFASSQFLDLTDDQTLSRPSFEPMRSGLSAGGASVDRGSTTLVATTYKTVAVDGTAATQQPPWPLDILHAQAVLSPPEPPAARPAPPRFSLQPDTLRTVAGTTGPPLTAALAAQSAGRARLLDQVALAGERP